jgi:DNA-binding IclR family transcriptional regulator
MSSTSNVRSAAAAPTPAPAGPRYQAPALEKGLDIVELLAGEPAPLTQQQIAQRLGRSASEIFRMLEVLERRAWIARSAEGGYATTLMLFELAHRQAPVHRLLTAALPEMRALARDTGQSNHLVVHHDRRILVLAQVESPEAMGFSVRQGAHFPFRLDRVSAWVLAAFQTPAGRASMVDELLDGDPHAPPRTALMRQLDRIRRRGYEKRRSDTLPGITDLCLPILDQHRCAVATLAQPYLAQRDVAVTIDQALDRHAEAAARISALLGAPAPARAEARTVRGP